MQTKIETCENSGSKARIEICYSFSHENKALFIGCSHTPTGVRSIVGNARAKGGLFCTRDLNYGNHEGVKNWLEGHLRDITACSEYGQVKFILVAADVNLASSGKRDFPLFLTDNFIKDCLIKDDALEGDNVVIKKILFSSSEDTIELAKSTIQDKDIACVLTKNINANIKNITAGACINFASDQHFFRRNSDAITAAPSAESVAEDSPTLNYTDLS